MELDQYIDKKVKLYDQILGFIEGENDFNFDQNILKNRSETIETIHIITKISANHHRCNNFYDKIKRILDYFLDQIKNIYSIPEIYDLFKKDKIILLYFFEKGILTPDQSLIDFLQIDSLMQNISDDAYFFYPEVKTLDSNLARIMENNLNQTNPQILKDFNEKRLLGENDSHICSLIRNDSVEDFIKYVNKTNYSLSSEINHSIFETNPFLIKNSNTSLIEYAAFVGSIQIYQYLRINKVHLSSKLWLYAIHGNNPLIIHLLEEDRVKPDFNLYNESLREAIKCHHNNLTNYIKDNLLDSNFIYEIKNFHSNIYSTVFHFF